MAVVKYKTNLFKPRLGVCSTWLASIDHTTNVKIPVWIKKATISFPKLLETPVIMIGPGKKYMKYFVTTVIRGVSTKMGESQPGPLLIVQFYILT